MNWLMRLFDNAPRVGNIVKVNCASSYEPVRFFTRSDKDHIVHFRYAPFSVTDFLPVPSKKNKGIVFTSVKEEGSIGNVIVRVADGRPLNMNMSSYTLTAPGDSVDFYNDGVEYFAK